MTEQTRFTPFEQQLNEALEASNRGGAHIIPGYAVVHSRFDKNVTAAEYAALTFPESLGDRSFIWIDDGYIDSKGPGEYSPRTLEGTLPFADVVLLWDLTTCSADTCDKAIDFITDPQTERLILITTSSSRVDDWRAVVRQHAAPGTLLATMTPRKAAA